MLPFTLLALLAPLIRADSSIIIPSRTSIVRDLFPPYAAGPATYYASVAAVNSQGTVYAITCLKPTTFPTPDPQSRDPCLTSSLGDSSQTFTQGKDTWMVTRSATPSPTDGPFFTECAMKTASSLTEQDEGVLSCFVRRSLDGFGPETRGGDGNSIFGMQRQAVTITGGFELLGDAGATAEPTSGAGFTDIGATPTTAGPVTTVTLHKTNGNAGSRRLPLEFGTITAFVCAVILFSTI